MQIVEIQGNDGLKFEKVEFRKIRVQDLNRAERMAGTSEGIRYTIAVLSQVCTFDGQKLPMEEIERMEANDFLLLSQKLLNTNLVNLGNQSSSSADTPDSALIQ